jgi:hypothetical protein
MQNGMRIHARDGILKEIAMKFNPGRLFLAALMGIVAVLILAGCSSGQDPTSRQVRAINTLRSRLDLPNSPLEFVELTFDPNSPSGNLQVAVFKDSDGRKYSVDPITDQVVEMDARALLDKIMPMTPVLSESVIRARALRIISASIPGFETLRTGWTYQEGGKVDNYFFNWYAGTDSGSGNRPRAQIALHRTGLLFGYYNTLMLGK